MNIIAPKDRTQPQIKQALIYLSSVCDGAASEDKQGFNGSDSSFGKSLAQQAIERDLSPRQQTEALKMLRKYKKQLSKAGIVLPTADEFNQHLQSLDIRQIEQVALNGWVARNTLKGTEYTVIALVGDGTFQCSCFKSFDCPHTKLVAERFPNAIADLKRMFLEDESSNDENYVPYTEEVNGDWWQEPEDPEPPAAHWGVVTETAPAIVVEPESPYRQPLSKNQKEAFDLIHEWFFASPSEPFVLKGYAGTGKSFSVQQIVKSLQDVSPKRLRVALCAPTHKARHVLESFAYKAGLSVYISTLHSLLHVMPGEYDENGKQLLTVNQYSSEPHYREFDLVVIDESSMLGEELIKFIPKNIPTIYMGDPAQLPPVETESDTFDLSPIFAEPNGIELTQVMRYEGAIAEYVTELRNNISQQFPPKLVSGGNIIKLKPTEWEALLLDTFGDECDTDDVRVLAWTNKRVATINELIRSRRYPDASHAYVVGERLMAKEPVFWEPEGSRYRQILMHSCAECLVEEAKDMGATALNGVQIDLLQLRVLTDLGDRAEIMTVTKSSWESFTKVIRDWKKQILELPKSERKSEWKEWYKTLEELNVVCKGNNVLPRLQYAYSLTVHQAQGSTFKTVFVDSSNIFGCRQNEMRNRLLYTAYTRASEQLIVLSKY